MKEFLRTWFVGIHSPKEAFRILAGKPAPLRGLVSILVRFTGTSLTSILLLHLLHFKPFVQPYITLLSPSNYYRAEIFFLPFFGIGAWLLSSALVHMILRISGQENSIDRTMNVIGFSLLVVMPVVWFLDWAGIAFGFYGRSFTIPIHAGVSLWEIMLMGIGFREGGSKSRAGALALGTLVKAGIYIPLAALLVR